MPKFSAGKEAKYTIAPPEFAGYNITVLDKDGKELTKSDDGYLAQDSEYTIKYTYVDPLYKDINVNVVWNDETNLYGRRPDKMTVKYMGRINDTKEIEITAADGWKATISGAPIYNNGVVINYGFSCDGFNENNYSYTQQFDNSESAVANVTISMKYKGATNTKDIMVDVVWDDKEDRYGKRPESVDVSLYNKDSSQLVEKKDLSAENAYETDNNIWRISFDGLTLYQGDETTPINYNVMECDIYGYDSDSEPYGENAGFVIKNTLVELNSVDVIVNDAGGMTVEDVAVELLEVDESGNATKKIKEWKSSGTTEILSVRLDNADSQLGVSKNYIIKLDNIPDAYYNPGDIKFSVDDIGNISSSDMTITDNGVAIITLKKPTLKFTNAPNDTKVELEYTDNGETKKEQYTIDKTFTPIEILTGVEYKVTVVSVPDGYKQNSEGIRSFKLESDLSENSDYLTVEDGVATFNLNVVKDTGAGGDGDTDTNDDTNKDEEQGHVHKAKKPATCTEPALCECGESIGKALGHNWGAWEKISDKHHQRICKNDKSHKQAANHTIGKAATCDESAVCKECKDYYGKALGHKWGSCKEISPTKHQWTCEHDSKHVKTEDHKPKIKCGTDAKCDSCGAHGADKHSFDTKTWKADSESHWHECIHCGQKKDEEEHDYNKAVDKKVPQTCPICKYGGHITRVTPGTFKDEDIPQTLKEAGFETVADIENKMQNKMQDENPDIKSGHAELYDALLEYSVDGGKTWYPASRYHFPDDGRLSVTLEVPEGTSIDTHDYTVLHMFSSDAFGKRAGNIEKPGVLEEKGADGKEYIKFYVTGLSPIMVAWEEATSLNTAENTDGDIPIDDNNDGEIDRHITEDEFDEDKYEPIDKDGDGDIDYYVPKDKFDKSKYAPIDKNGDGKADYYIPNGVLTDPDGDGIYTPDGKKGPKYEGVDLDGDGIIDMYVLLTEGDGVDSGDDSDMLPWLLVMMTALTAAGVTVVGGRYRRN